MRNRIHSILVEAVRACMRDGLLNEAPVPAFGVEVPGNAAHGHFASNLPLAMAKVQRRPPMQIAEVIAGRIPTAGGFLHRVQAAPPGFLNFWIMPEAWRAILPLILRQGEDYGRNDLGGGRRVLVEFVSANPTGPLHLGHGRGAALGDTLCRILSFCGYHVSREFYINDAGMQIRLLGESIYSRLMQRSDPGYPFPENGYHGDYVPQMAEAISRETTLSGLPPEEAIRICAEKGRDMLLQEIKADLARFRVRFDTWYPESSLFSSGALDSALKRAHESGHLYEREGAQWVRTSEFGDDKDRVIQKSDGQFTYFASDISYHLDKKGRDFDRAVNIWGADHHGYVPRIKAALAAFGLPGDWLSVLLIQLVKLYREGSEIKMSKRAGAYVTLGELMDEVGVDAVRYVFLTKHHDSPLDFDVDLVKKQDSDNPVYYVQYAHARICSIFRKAAEEGVSLPEAPAAPLGRLVLGEEIGLIRTMAEFPGLVEDMAGALEPHRLTYYLGELAGAFHRYFNLGNRDPDCRIITPDRERSQARLVLAQAVKTVVGNGLTLLGVSRPERM